MQRYDDKDLHLVREGEGWEKKKEPTVRPI